MKQKDESYVAVFQTVRAWPAHQRYLLLQELLRTLEPGIESATEQETLKLARGLLSINKNAPTDEDIAQWLEEHRLEKYS